MNKNDSKCPKMKYCEFAFLAKIDRFQIERCEFCGKKVAYKLTKNGDVFDRMKYMRDHIRDSAQPFGATKRAFFEIYGRKPLDDLKVYSKERARIAQNKKDFDGVFEEAKKWATSKTF